MRIVYTHLHSDQIFNLCDPAHLPEIILDWTGKEPFWSSKYDQLRQIVRGTYVDAFNAENGHYDRLYGSIREEGLRNPVVLAYGRLRYRLERELPPGFDHSKPVCEYMGGSRILIAGILGVDVPCIINDATDSLEGEVLGSRKAIEAKFADKPASISFSSDGVRINDVPHHHMPDEYTHSEQVLARKRVMEKVLRVVDEWMAEHD